MNALFLFAALSFAEPAAYEQAVACAEGRCWNSRDAGGTAVAARPSGERPSVSFSTLQKGSRREAPAPASVAPGEKKPSMWQDIKTDAGKFFGNYGANLVGAGVVGYLGLAFAGPWGLLAGAIIGWMLPNLIKKASRP